MRSALDDPAGLVRRVSYWQPDRRNLGLPLMSRQAERFPWFELACGSDRAEPVMDVLGEHCPGLTMRMLDDLLTPDDEPAGHSYADGDIRLASSFSVAAQRPGDGVERGTPQGVGVLVFQPVELLAGSDWMITCWHPRRVFQGATKLEERPAGDADAVHRAVEQRWKQSQRETPGDLGVSVMHELALTYAPAHRALYSWLGGWELSLYVEDDVDNHDQLPELWGLMAVLRDWLNPLNKPGLRSDPDKAWLPVTSHEAVIEVDDRVDKALSNLAKLSETLRQSFGLLHLVETEEQRQHSEHMQRRLEIAAVVFLVPTLIVGFYGANTWVPGQGKHWGFWVMVAALVLLSISALFAVLYFHHRSNEAVEAEASARERRRSELLRSG